MPVIIIIIISIVPSIHWRCGISTKGIKTSISFPERAFSKQPAQQARKSQADRVDIIALIIITEEHDGLSD